MHEILASGAKVFIHGSMFSGLFSANIWRMLCSTRYWPMREDVTLVVFSLWASPCSVRAMMMSWNGNILRVTGPLCGEFTGHRWILLTKANDAELWFFICAWINDWVNSREAGHLRRHRAHYDVNVMSGRDMQCPDFERQSFDGSKIKIKL